MRRTEFTTRHRNHINRKKGKLSLYIWFISAGYRLLKLIITATNAHGCFKRNEQFKNTLQYHCCQCDMDMIKTCLCMSTLLVIATAAVTLSSQATEKTYSVTLLSYGKIFYMYCNIYYTTEQFPKSPCLESRF